MKTLRTSEWVPKIAKVALYSWGLVGACSLAFASSGGIEWSLGGQNTANSRNQGDQKTLSPANASRLKIKWKTTVHGDVTATPAVTGGAVYFPDWGGYIDKLDEKSGAVIWSIPLASYAGEGADAVSRTSPAVVDGVVYIGDQTGNVLAINATTGKLIWITNIDPTQPGGLALVTQSPMVHGGIVYAGTGSNQEGAAASNGYPCCTHRGTFSALNATTGAILWTFFTEPPNPADLTHGAFSGGGVWGSTAAVDPASKTVYIGTGNNYSTTAAAQACHVNAVINANSSLECPDPADFHDSIVALDAVTGNPKWITGPQQLWDSWNVACLFGGTNCPQYNGPDYDFATGPQLLTVTDPATGRKTRAVGIGEKSGHYWLLDATTGAVKWVRQVAGGSTLGGIEWGTSTDGSRIYISSTDNGQQDFFGHFTALDVATGNVVWDRADPNQQHFHLGPTSVSNGVMLAGSMDGTMYAFNAATGATLWSFRGQGSSNAGPAIGLDGTLYWGNGYSHFGLGSASTTFYAFSVDGK